MVRRIGQPNRPGRSSPAILQPWIPAGTRKSITRLGWNILGVEREVVRYKKLDSGPLFSNGIPMGQEFLLR